MISMPSLVRVEIARQARTRAESVPSLPTDAEVEAALANVSPELQSEFEQVWWPAVIKRNLAEVEAHLARHKRELAGTQPQSKPAPIPRTTPAVASSNPLLANKLTIPQAKRMFGTGTTVIRQLILAGQIPVVKIGGRYLLLEKDIADFIAKRYGPVKPSEPKNKAHALAKYRNSPLLDRNIKL